MAYVCLMGGNDIAQNTVHGCTIFSAKDSFQKMTGIIEGNELRADIEDIAKTAQKVAIFPTAPLQLPK